MQWSQQISSDTRHDWWQEIVKLDEANDRRFPDAERFVRFFEQALAEDDERDINKLDSRGKTALHTSVSNCNFEAVQGLLECGADINVLDVHGDTPLSCTEFKGDYPILGYLQFHIKKLILFKMYVRNINMQCFCESHEHEDVRVGPYDPVYVAKWTDKLMPSIPRTIKNCMESIEQLKSIRIDEQTTLHSILHDGAEKLAESPMKLRELEKIVKAKDFYEKFGGFFKLGCLLKLVYRLVCARRKLLPDVEVEQALQVLFKSFKVHDKEALIKNLNDFDMTKVLEAVNMKQE